jgi:hypothetical protein
MTGPRRDPRHPASRSSTLVGTTDSSVNPTAPGKMDKEKFALARTALRPTVQGALTLRESSVVYRNFSLSDLANALSEQTRAAGERDLSRAVAMFTVQAHTLDAIFNSLARSAMSAEHVDTADSYLKLALRAQSHCQATWGAISMIQNPPIAGYVNQANIAHGDQQVNNGFEIPACAPNEISKTKLLEQTPHGPDEWLDQRTPEAAERIDSSVVPLEQLDRAKVG